MSFALSKASFKSEKVKNQKHLLRLAWFLNELRRIAVERQVKEQRCWS